MSLTIIDTWTTIVQKIFVDKPVEMIIHKLKEKISKTNNSQDQSFDVYLSDNFKYSSAKRNGGVSGSPSQPQT